MKSGVQVSVVNLATVSRQSVYCEVCQGLCNDFSRSIFLKGRLCTLTLAQALVVNLAMFSLAFGEKL